MVKVTQGNTTVAEGETKALNVGQSATLTVTPDAGYIPQKAVINGTEYALTKNGSNYEYSFNMPNAATTVSATLLYVVTYSVTTLAATNGSISVDKTTASKNETITVTATPKRGYVLGTLTVLDKNDSLVTPISGSGNTRTFTMPESDVKVSATFTSATSYSIEAAQVTTGSGTVTVKITDSSGNVLESLTADTTEGISMTAYEGEKLVVTVSPSAGYQLDTLTANGGSRSSGYEVAISSDITDISATFKKTTAKNQYTANLGSGTSGTYNKIKATFFDYYTNGEFNKGWITGIDDWERGENQENCVPYTQLNAALSNYTGSSVTYPIYFGNFYNKSSTGLNNFVMNVNNSNGLGGDNKSVPGLTGKMLTGSGYPAYYKSGATNENGLEMKLFDKDWLSSSANGQGELATIIDSPFPMEIQLRDVNNSISSSGTHTYYEFDSASRNLWFSDFMPTYDNSTVYWDNSNTEFYVYNGTTLRGAAKFYTSDESVEVYVNCELVSGNIYKAAVPDDGNTYTKVRFCMMKGDTTENNDSNRKEKTDILTIPDGTTNKLCYKTEWNGVGNNMKGEWKSYTGEDKRVAPTNAKVNTSTSGSDKVHCPNYGREGMFPFDHSHAGTNSVTNRAWDLGFGVSMEIKFTLGPEGKTEDGAPQVFEFTGDDDLWVFVDDHLVLDLGGDHKQTEGSINFNTLSVSAPYVNGLTGATRNQKFGEWPSSSGSSVGAGGDYWFDTTKSSHTMKIFYLERGMFDSNLKFGFSMYPVPDIYEVENIVDIRNLNPGLQSQYSDNFTFTNTSYDDKGAGVDYDLYKSSDDSVINEGLTTDSDRQFPLNINTVGSGDPVVYNPQNKYAKFTKTFTVGQNLSTLETSSGYYQYDTSYKVLDVENGSSIVKAGDGTNTNNFKYRTTAAGADPDIDPTHIRSQFTNVLKTGSFMLTKDILDFDDTDTAFPFVLSIKLPGSPDIVLETEGLTYTSSDSGSGSLGAGGTGVIHEYEYLTFEGIPLGAEITVTEPFVLTTEPDKDLSVDYTVNGTGAVNFYKLVTIDNNSTISGNTTTYTRKSDDSSSPLYNEYTDVSFTLQNFDTVTITNKPKNYRLDYKFTSRLYGDKIYKLTGFLTPDMVEKSYASVDNDTHKVALTRNFASDNIPYESNFMKDITWNSNPARGFLVQGVKEGFDDYNIFTSSTDSKTLSVSVDTDGDGAYDKTITGLTCGQSILDGGSYVSGTKSGDTPSYWNVYKMDELSGAKGEFVTRCYSTDFMYVAYDNYFVDAVYGAGKNTELYTTLREVTSVDLGVTRNHWNDTVSGSNDSYGSYDLADTEYDRLYVDFTLSYNINGLLLNSNDTTGVTVGYKIVILNKDTLVPTKVVKTVYLNKSELDNKNRAHAYYGFKNTPANRGYLLGIIAFAQKSGETTESAPMVFELDTVGSKPASNFYDIGI